jgi:hypothetical protein
LLPGLAAVMTAYYAFNTGIFTALKNQIDAEDKAVTARRSEVAADVKKLEADKVLLEAQRAKLEGSLDSEKKLQEVQRERLQLQNEVLSQQQKDLDQRKLVFDRDKAKLDQQIADLTRERAELLIAVKKQAIEVPLQNLLSTTEAWRSENPSNDNYEAIIQVLKRDPNVEVREAVEKAVTLSKNIKMQALLYRSLFFATERSEYLDRLIDITRLQRETPDQNFWNIFSYGVGIDGWPAQARKPIFETMLVILSDIGDSGEQNRVRLAIIRAMESICRRGCELEPDTWPKAAVLVRDVLLTSVDQSAYTLDGALALIRGKYPPLCYSPISGGKAKTEMRGETLPHDLFGLVRIRASGLSSSN